MAVVLGKADNAEDVVKVVKDYQSKGIMTFMVGDVIEQCAEGGVKMGLELRVIPLGHDVTSVIHVVTVAIRAALIFGNVQPGNLAALLDYTKNRVPAFVNTFGAIDSVVVSAGAGAIALGFPVVVDIDLGENQVPGALESVCDHAETVKKSLELRNIKIKVKELPIPVAFAAAFEGEIIRKADMHNEIWSAKNPTAELVVMRELNEIEDHKITIVGPDFDQAKDLALATYVEVAGKKMQVDFESVIERKFHAWFNYMEGVMHTGQRNQVRIRVSNAAYDAGLRLKDFAEVLYVMIMDEFDAVVDKCQITLITDAAEAEVLTGLTDRVEAAKMLHDWGAKEVVITHNTEVLAYDGNKVYTCPIKARNLSGRTGRGDTTFAGYIAERQRGSVEEALNFCTALVSLKMETPGPFKGTREDVLAYMKEFY